MNVAAHVVPDKADWTAGSFASPADCTAVFTGAERTN